MKRVLQGLLSVAILVAVVAAQQAADPPLVTVVVVSGLAVAWALEWINEGET